MRRQEKERRVSDDDDDWFGNRLKEGSNRGNRKKAYSGGVQKAIDVRQSTKTKLESPGDRLLARISSASEQRHSEKQSRKDEHDESRHRENRRKRRERELRNGRTSEKGNRMVEQGRGQQYYGSYGR